VHSAKWETGEGDVSSPWEDTVKSWKDKRVGVIGVVWIFPETYLICSVASFRVLRRYKLSPLCSPKFGTCATMFVGRHGFLLLFSASAQRNSGWAKRNPTVTREFPTLTNPD
jgi:hypothetical protein